MKNNFVVINFFRVTDPYSGGSEVSFNFFNEIPSNNKKLFQYSDNKKKYENVESFYIKNSIIQKILNLKKFAEKIFKYCENKKKLIIIIEGASWAGYSFLLYRILKKKLNNAKYIYHSQNIEYLLRKNKGNFIIALITKYFENKIAKNFDIFTCTSKEEKKQINNLYKINASVLPNGINIPKNIFKIKEIKKEFNYIFFCGNIDYSPNYNSLKYLVNNIMPEVLKTNSNIKLIITGNKHLPFKKSFLINAGFVKKKIFFQYLKGASLFVNPMKITFGVQTKTLHSLALGKTIISSTYGVKGVKLNPYFKNVHISNNTENFTSLILKKINSPKTNKKIGNFYLKKYDMENVVKKFFKKHKLLS